MGMYTEYEATIKIPINDKTRDLLNYINLQEYEVPFSDHEFFKCKRYTHLISGCKLEEEEWGYYSSPENTRILIIKTDMKNYDNEIKKFVDFISDYTEDEILGHSIYEEDFQYTYHFNKNKGKK